MNRTLDVLTSSLASAARLGRGVTILPGARRPKQLLELYDLEGCPRCRRVRETLTHLDLDALIYPCPSGGAEYRDTVDEVPTLVDPGRGQTIAGAGAIVDYLFATYGGGRPRPRPSRIDGAASRLASALRGRHGTRARASHRPEQPLELYSFDASPYARLARETLCELELPYVLHNVGKGATIDWLPPAMRARVAPKVPASTANRRALVDRAGRMQVPYLVDPNTGVEMFESAAIVHYLEDTYAA